MQGLAGKKTFFFFQFRSYSIIKFIITDPGAHSGIETFGRDKLIAIVAGCVGGIILVIIIVCIVTRVRAQKKTKTLSLLNHTLSLDQFYMENPK